MLGQVKRIIITVAPLIALLVAPVAVAHGPVDPETAARFQFLSENGNSNCSLAFMEAIPSMPADSRLQGSCCSPMDLERYAGQIEGLKKYATLSEIPPDPYDIPAPLAQKGLADYDITLTPTEQQAYDLAMQTSAEKGPCCCKCWRWHVYGGIAKALIRNRGFTGQQVAEVWNLSDGCGSGEGHT